MNFDYQHINWCELTYCEYRAHILTCEFLGKPPVGIYARIKEFTDRIWKDMSFTLIPVVSNPRLIVAHKNGNIHFTVDTKNGEVTCDLHRTVFYLTGHIGMDDRQAGELMEGIIKDHLSISDIHVTKPTMYTQVVKTGLSIGLPISNTRSPVQE